MYLGCETESTMPRQRFNRCRHCVGLAIAISVPNSTESRFQTGYRFTGCAVRTPLALAARAGGFRLMEQASCNRRTQNRSNISESCDDISTRVLLDLQQENEIRGHDSARRICRRRAVVFMRMRTYPAAKLRTRDIAELVIRIRPHANGEPDLTGCRKSHRRHSGARRRREPGIQISRESPVTGFRVRRHSASKTRVNALVAASRNDAESFSATC
jgi:hypothetical protein